ncbi:MAG: pseudouridine synthase, partial [Desulfomonilaceae bacterium]
MNTRPTESHIPSHLIIPDFVVPGRADKILADLLPGEITRSSISRLLKHGFVTWEGRQIKPSAILRPGQEILILHLESASELSSPPDEIVKRPEILFEDEHVIVLDKPAGLVIHPGAGRSSTTLMDILVDSRPGMIGIGEPGRWGIVHRLDKDTSGVMVVAKSTAAYNELSNQFRLHSVGKIYLALVRGNPG